MAGLYFEDFAEGQVYQHAVRRTVTETDHVFFTTLTHDTTPEYLDEEYARTTPLGTRRVNDIYTMALVCAAHVTELTLGTTVGNLGWDEVRYYEPVIIGDTLRSETRVMALRESRKWPTAGIVTFEHSGHNQRDELVVVARRVALMMRRPVAA
jgi:acyl dehydratase